MGNSIEETIKQLKLMLKVRKEQKEIIECAGGSCINCDPDIKALSESIDILSEYKKILKENEELKQDRNNNYQMIALAQNEALGYMQGYEDGKKLKRSAIANIVENQQYYIFNKQIEHYKEYTEKLKKENEKALAEYMKWQKQELGRKDKIIDLMAETINNHDIDEDICKQMGQKANCNEFEDTEKCKECIKQYFINKAKEIK